METRRWTNPTQPQTLYLAQWLLYIQGGFALLIGLLSGSVIQVVIGGVQVGAAYGIANEKRWGWTVGVVVAGLAVALMAWEVMVDLGRIFNVQFLIGLGFGVALLALLIHPQSRDYLKIWFT